jgi:predicted DNA-binding WGR domain protein
MTGFHEFLRQRLAAGGFSTGDVLASFLPLARQVVDAHASGRVAPLDGVSALHVEGSRIWFHDDALAAPSSAQAELRRLDRPAGTVEVLSDRRRTLDVEQAGERVANLQVGKRDEPLTRPVYLPGYACWEHAVGHHDPVTDVFSLGQVLASLACGLDLAEPSDLEAFVSNRRNLFALRPGLHPVIAKAIVKMTELGRRDRPQELATLVHNLEHYRDQGVDFDFDLASAEATAGDRARRPVILGKLRERLFELSRRNRLLHFRATLSSVNLTHASVPLAFDVQHIRPEQVLTWSGRFAGALSAGEPVSLNGHLDFAEQLYLPSVLDRIRTDAARDAAEFGFEQLRLATCFLRWTNLKEDPPEHYDSPLVLLPVRLVKKKGVRDSWWLQPLGTEAEVNPVVRHLFAQLYGIQLPETIDLSEGSLDALFDDLSARVAVSEPGVTLRKVERPRIDLIHDLARRRLDRYRRSARLAGRGIRSFLEVDYSYDPANFHPLGLALFRARVRARPTHLREILQERPAPRSWAAPPTAEEPAVATREASFYALREASDDNPYHWDFDLCRVTLGNFKYRKMTLVRDYAQLLDGDPGNEAFDAVFSLAPRPVEWEAPRTSPLPERYPVVACDPTQASAIALARAGASYIIQGPPGTGKSQTITNLVADYVVQGKRVLFVCEKRAAIDVVYARLRQQGLDSLCCLIHDSQADKKAFIQDLKATYERLLAEPTANPRTWRGRRDALLDGIRRELEPLEAFDAAMRAAPATAGVPLRAAIERALELADERPALAAPVRDGLPAYADWVAHAEAVAGLSAAIADQQPDAIFAHHPLRLLGPAVVGHPRPAQLVGAGVTAAREALGALRAALGASGVDPALAPTLDAALALGEWADRVSWLARRELGALLEERSEPSRRFARARQALASAREALARSTAATIHWAEKLPRDEAAAALAQASAFEGSWLAPLRPAWWRLRKVLTARYAFARHAIRPTWSQVLRALVADYEAADAVSAADRAGREALGVEESLDEVAAEVEAARRGVAGLPRALAALHDELFRSDRCAARVAGVAAILPPARALKGALGEFAAAFEAEPLDRLGDALRAIEGALPRLGGALEVLGLLAKLPAPLAAAFRTLPLTPRQLEAALVSRCVDELLQSDRLLHRFDGAVRDRHLAQLARLSALWQEANAGTVGERAREAFLEKVRIASLPAAELTREQKEFKAAYSRGRRDLEHELGKVMRHKSIRDLVAGDSGPVVFDLKPVWLMSPLSVSDTLPLRADAFDVVIFDEASQITLESAVPSLFRAPQAIVVGDEMQLPPTDFFSSRAEDRDDEGLRVGEADQLFEYDLSANSFLNHAGKNLPSRMLGWHYRSRSESLIGFSNWAFYQGRLLTVPESAIAGAEAGAEIVARTPADGDANVAKLLGRPLSHHLVEGGTYDSRRNRAEAAYVARLVRGLLADPKRPTIGVIAFSEAQQGEIESALAALAAEDEGFAQRLDAEWDREEDGQFVGLLVKNLENIQGDERDVVILSVCYARAPDGKMRMNFGPINQSGGERRLNVAFSRAKRHMAVVASIGHSEITNDYNDGANCLKSYLRYAECASAGDAAGARRVLRELAVWRELEGPVEPQLHAMARQLAEALVARGYAVEEGAGMSHFRCDLAVRRHGDARHRLGLLIDSEAHYRQEDLLERDLMRPSLLRAFDWQVALLLSADWYRDREAVLARIVRLVEGGEQAVDADAPEEGEDPWAELDASVAAAEPSPAATNAAGVVDSTAAVGTSREADAGVGTGVARRLEFVGGRSSKFWEVRVDASAVIVRFGRIGTDGQRQQKLYADPAAAARAAARLLREKLAKGYVERPAGAGD